MHVQSGDNAMTTFALPAYLPDSVASANGPIQLVRNVAFKGGRQFVDLERRLRSRRRAGFAVVPHQRGRDHGGL